ncbi:MAG TPA: Gfo/Idh/MocA family oxidoreductase [Verrucomicrobiae bacterium]|nr:Gfo/Idh/MocA family oxidoreductase [Verrucomicrobiae bacterium]
MKKLSRRRFLGKSTLAAGLAPIALSQVGPFIRSVRAEEPGPNDKIRLGVIGCGGQGLYDFKDFLSNPEVDCAVVCDVDDKHIAMGLDALEKARGKKADSTKEFRDVLDRKDVDIVLVATPDHWHAMPTVYACQAGKDVYVEKPLAKTIDEGNAMREAVRRHNRVVQMGSQWKSCKHIIEATDLIRAGKIGKVHMVRGWAYLDWVGSIGNPADCPPPPGVDYDRWLGPAPKRPFNPNRFHFNFRWFWDYAGGLMTDWGVHLINMMLMGMGPDAPLNVFSTGAKYITDNTETPDSQIAVYQFPDYMLVWEHRKGLNNGLNGRSWGVEWNGADATIILNDEGYQIIPEPKGSGNIDGAKKPGSGNPHPAHVRNFLDCVKSRQQPVLNLEIGQHVSTVAHLGNIAYRTGRKIHWNAEKQQIVGDHEANQLVGVKYRKPWHLPYARMA